jgi:eukaryotic-like serine/threonine-protein kinase
VLYELLVGFRPFDAGGDLEMLKNLMAGRYKAPRALDAAIPEELERIIAKALMVDRELRYATAAAMGEDLEQWLLSTRMRVGARELAAYVKKMCPPEEGPVTAEPPTPVEDQPVAELVGRATLRNMAPIDVQTDLKPMVVPRPAMVAPPVPSMAASGFDEPDPITATAEVPRPWLPWVGGAVAFAVGVGAVLVMHEASAPPPVVVMQPQPQVVLAAPPPPAPPPAPPPPEPEPVIEQQAPEPLPAARAPVPPPKKKSSPAPATVAPLKAYLNVKATRPGVVFVDGASLGTTPVKRGGVRRRGVAGHDSGEGDAEGGEARAARRLRRRAGDGVGGDAAAGAGDGCGVRVPAVSSLSPL